MKKQNSRVHVAPTSVRAELETDRHALTVAEFIPGRLFFVTFKNKTHRNTTDVHYFTTDEELVYINYYNDFGPLNLAAIVKYIRQVNFKLRSPSLTSKALVHFTSANEKKRVNAALLMAVYAIACLDMTPNDTFNHLSSLRHPFLSFPDATVGDSQYKMRLIDCLNAVRKAIYFGIVNFDDFNLEEFEKMENIKFGDLTWIVPQKFLAFSGPVDSPEDECYHSPEHYVEYFRENGVKSVVRLNMKMYNSKAFSSAGLAHYDLYFADGSVPSHDIVSRFFDIAENTSGAVAIHCKAGLGRTGTLIAAFLIKHYRMTALESIAWLEQMEPSLWNMGDAFRMRYHGGADRIPHHKYGIYSYRTSKTRGSAGSYHSSTQAIEDTPVSSKESSIFSQQSVAENESQGDKLNAKKRMRDVQNVLSYKTKTAKTKSWAKITNN